MNFLLYYILRRFFVTLEIDDRKIMLTKGLILKRTSTVQIPAIVKTVVKRSPLLRLFHAKEVMVFTYNGEIKFFLSENEQITFIPEMPKMRITPRFREILFGAFIDTRALAGIAFFTAILRKISIIIGGSYFDGLISALMTTAEKLSQILLVIHVAVPQVAAFAAVFAVCSWIFAFTVKLLRLSGFCLSRKGELIYIKSGIFTLYETVVVRNTAAVVMRKTVICQFAGRTPVYCHNTMMIPALAEKDFTRVLEKLFGMKHETAQAVKTPFKNLAGHCVAPLWVFGVSLAALVLFYMSVLRFAQLLKTAIYCALIGGGYVSVCGVILMKNAQSSFGQNRITLSFRRGTAVYIACFPRGISRSVTLSQSIFQRFSNLCDYRTFIVGRKSYKAKQLPF